MAHIGSKKAYPDGVLGRGEADGCSTGAAENAVSEKRHRMCAGVHYTLE